MAFVGGVCVLFWFGFKQDAVLWMNEKCKAFDSGLEEFQQGYAWIHILYIGDVLITYSMFMK